MYVLWKRSDDSVNYFKCNDALNWKDSGIIVTQLQTEWKWTHFYWTNVSYMAFCITCHNHCKPKRKCKHCQSIIILMVVISVLYCGKTIWNVVHQKVVPVWWGHISFFLTSILTMVAVWLFVCLMSVTISLESVLHFDEKMWSYVIYNVHL